MNVPSGSAATRTCPDRSDEALLEAIASGSEHALDEFIRRHRRNVRAAVRRFITSAADADEAVQDVFVLVWRRARQFRGQAKATTWIHAIARNVAFSRLRRLHGVMLPLNSIVLDPLDFRAWQADPERQAAAAELRRRLVLGIATLSPIHRTVIVGILRHGAPKEAASSYGMTKATLCSRLHRARAKLRAALPDPPPDRVTTATHSGR